MYGIPPCIQVCHRCTLGVSGELNDEISWNGLEFIKLNSSCYIITNCVMHLYHVHSCLKVLCNVIEAGPHCVLTFCTQLFSQLQEDVILGDLLPQKMFIENMCTDIFYIQDFWKTLRRVNCKQQQQQHLLYSRVLCLLILKNARAYVIQECQLKCAWRIRLHN